MTKQITASEAVDMIKEGSTILVAGFLCIGSAVTIMDRLAERGTKNLTLVVNDTGRPTLGCGKLAVNRQLKRVITSHIGLNPEVGKQMNKGEVEVELVPQGTFVERIRCGGSGLGGFYTPTGVGTEVENGKEKKIIDGKEYIFEKPLRGDIAIIKGSIVDESGNVYYNATTRNFNPIMAMAADIVICEAEKIVKVGEIDPHLVMTPGILVDYIVLEGGQ